MPTPTFRVISSSQAGSELAPLPHLEEISWIDFELEVAQNLSRGLSDELNKLKHHVNKERVHKSRVALRRWFSIWQVLKRDGWESKKFVKKILKPLRKLLRKLGAIRDMDINIDLGKRLGCPRALLKTFLKKRRKARAAVEDIIKKMDLPELLEKMNEYLQKQAHRLTGAITKTSAQDLSAATHFDDYIGNHEKLVEKLVYRANSPKALHELRLAVKQWRYLLTECLSLSNKELVMMQDCLGEIHDLDSFQLTLEKMEASQRILRRLKRSRRRHMQAFFLQRYRLPYGLRPGLRSFVNKTPASRRLLK